MVPDLVEDSLPDWSPLEEVPEDWELQSVPAGMEPMRLRPPITGGIAHQALGRCRRGVDGSMELVKQRPGWQIHLQVLMMSAMKNNSSYGLGESFAQGEC